MKGNINKFIEKANKVHNNKYDYKNAIYLGVDSKLEIICPIHGSFWQTPAVHLHGSGCPQCGLISRTNKRKHTKEEFIKRAREKHGDKFDYSKVNYVNSRTKVCIICPKHGEFWQIPNTHLGGHGCPKCAKRKSQVKLYERLKSDLLIELDFDKRLNWLGQ